MVMFWESNVTVHPASTIGAVPPSGCCNPGTICAGRDKDGANVVVPDEVDWRELPSGKMMGEDNVGMEFGDEIRCA
jgi:hypothetical protein